MFLIVFQNLWVPPPPKHDNLNLDNSETSSVASDSSHIDFQAPSTTNKDLKYTQQDLEKIKADIEKHYKIQAAIEKRNFEKEIQNYYHNHFKTVENEHKEKLSMIEAKNAEQINNEIKGIQASANEQNTKHLETIEMLQQKVKTLTQEINQTPSSNLATPPPFPLANQSMFYNQSTLNDSLVQMVDKLEKSILIQNSAIVQSLQQNKASSKEHYISSAKTYDGKDPKEFNSWLDSVTRLSRISDKELIEVAVATSTGQLHKYISELMALGLNWDAIKGMIQERFSEFGSSIVARNKLSSFTQKTMAMHEYISEFTTIMEHAHDIRPSDSKSTILASTFIDGIQNPYIRNKLRSHNVQNLSELYGLAIKEDQKQRIRDLNFGNTTPQETIAHCDVNAIKGTGCYKCGSNDHYIKDCPLSRDIGNTYNSSSNSQQKQYNAYSKDQRKAGHESSLEQSLQTMTDLLKSLLKQTNQSQSPYQSQSFHSKAPHKHFNTSKHHGHRQSNRHANHRSHHRNHHHKNTYRNDTRVNEIEECASDCTSSCSDQSDVGEEFDSQEPPTPEDPKN